MFHTCEEQDFVFALFKVILFGLGWPLFSYVARLENVVIYLDSNPKPNCDSLEGLPNKPPKLVKHLTKPFALKICHLAYSFVVRLHRRLLLLWTCTTPNDVDNVEC